MIRKVTITFFLVLSLGILSVGEIMAKMSPAPTPTPVPMPAISYETVNPDNGTQYILKRLKEKIALFFAFSSDQKFKQLKKETDVRMAELKYIIDNKQMGFFEKATQRYFTTAGKLTDLAVSNKISGKYQELKEDLGKHILLLNALRDTYHPTTAEWRFVEDDVNYVKQDIERLNTAP
ncbi:hypothetical protein HY404_00775 [Candidatus Microgenomates bacterium]|nr:hypothetical protein [Candidatus Microgenomates bacterium]